MFLFADRLPLCFLHLLYRCVCVPSGYEMQLPLRWRCVCERDKMDFRIWQLPLSLIWIILLLSSSSPILLASVGYFWCHFLLGWLLLVSLCGWLLRPQLADQVGAVHSVFLIGYSPSLATLNLRTFNELQIGVSNLTSWCHGVALVSRGNIVWLDSSLTFSLSLEKMLATSLSVIYVYGLVEIIIPGYHGHGGYLIWLNLLNWMKKKKKICLVMCLPAGCTKLPNSYWGRVRSHLH